MARSSLTALSLYSGAGGLDIGFGRSGFDVVWANEMDRHACDTYRANVGHHIVEGPLDVDAVPTDPVDVVIGGPPCQGWSRIGRMDPADPRSQHVHRFLDVVERVNPQAFVMENVAHLGEAPRWAGVRTELLSRARDDLDYRTEIHVLDASQHGVPQARRRMFMVGARRDVLSRPRRTSVESPPTVRRALQRLPAFGSPGNDSVCAARVVPAKKPIVRPSAFQGALLFNGSGRPLMLDRPARTLPASMGGNATPIIDQDELERGVEPWVTAYRDRLANGRGPVRVAPARLRRLTLEEAACLQSFPAGYEFHGPVNARFRQIGNAVPPAMAAAVARAVKRTLAS